MTSFLSAIKDTESKTRANRCQDDREPSILRLPPELLLEIITILWNSDFTEEDRLYLMDCLPLVCKAIAAAFGRVSQRVVRITSQEFYNNYVRRLSKLDRSHLMNTRCNSLCVYVDSEAVKRERLRLHRLANGSAYSPLFMQCQQYGLEYFNNGREFILKGLFPNLTNIFVEIRCITIQDAYHALFPHFMPRTVQNLNIHYICGIGPFELGPPDVLHRQTPIRYPSTSHKLKRLIVTGVKGRVDLARLWESLFEVEELIVDGQVLPVGEDAPWGLDMNQALDMLELGCKGVGWNWYRLRPWHPSDEHYRADWGEVVITGETVEQFGTDSADRSIRRPKSFSNLHDSLIGEKTTMRPLRRTKSCMSALPLTDYPYGLRVWRPELLESYSEYQVENLMF